MMIHHQFKVLCNKDKVHAAEPELSNAQEHIDDNPKIEKKHCRFAIRLLLIVILRGYVAKLSDFFPSCSLEGVFSHLRVC